MNGQNPIVSSLYYSDLFHGLLVNYTDGAFLGTEFTLPALLLTPCVATFIVRSAYKISSLSFPHFCKGKAVPLQAWSGPEGSRKLRFPDFMTMAQGGGKVVSHTHRPPLPPGNSPGTHFC